jgi:histidine triad (HIT) family protein
MNAQTIPCQESLVCMSRECVFCKTSEGGSDISVVVHDDKTMTLLDLGQFHTGHLLVAPRIHVDDLRDISDAMVDALILAVRRAVHVVDLEFPGDGVSVWRSNSATSDHGVAHVHFHVHPKHVLEHHVDRHTVTGNAPSLDSSTSIAERLRRRMLSTYDASVHQVVTRSSLYDSHTERRTAYPHSFSWCGCDERTTSWN